MIRKVRGQIVYSLLERLERRSKLNEQTGCVEWTGSSRNGYGRLCIGSREDGTRRSVSAHRLVLELAGHRIPEGMEVCHTCDNRKCINKDHLFIGTKADNMADRDAKGRNFIAKGELNGAHKLTESDVAKARILHPGMSYRSLAKRFGVCHKTMAQAIKGESWKHASALPAPPEVKP